MQIAWMTWIAVYMSLGVFGFSMLVALWLWVMEKSKH